ncbi:sensor histidine kinase [Catenulispora subtropica]|uniref:histidine kinase n=1 Tax=Catenulispora subtropica TaxID=450798 RepID=A0ABP5DJ34_9ACTN
MRTVPGSLGPGVGEAVRAARRLYRARPWAVDGVVAAAMLAVTVIWLNQYPYEPDGRHVYSVQDVHHVPYRPVDALGAVLTGLTCAAIAARRWRTEPVLLGTCALIAVYTARDYPPTTLAWCPILIFYTLCTRTVPLRAAPFALALFAVWLQYSLKLEVLGILLAVVQSVLVIVVTWSFGDQARRLAERNTRLASLTAQLRREQAARADRAVATERVRIARELHDVVAHHMSVISVQVGLARYVLAGDPATAGQAMDTIADANHEAMREMRRMLAVLRPVPENGRAAGRGRPPSVEPAPGLSGLDTLLDRVRAGGIEVDLRISGDPVALPPGPDLCCYRIAQESLTNIMKHAAGATAVVELTYENRAVTLRVADDGGRVRSLMDADGAGPASPERTGTGNGLVGMRERARIYGGTLTAGRRVAGGFEVVLALPIGDAQDGPET